MGALAVYRSSGGRADASRVRRMLEAAPHRGSVHRIGSAGATALGVSSRGGAGGAWLSVWDEAACALVGTLDDVHVLRAEVGATVASDDPSALVLQLVRRDGTDALARLRGSFAGAICDRSGVTVFRDQFGSRPVFHRHDASGYFAATEIKQVVAGAGIPREPDLDQLRLVFFGIPEDGTAVRGVQRLPRASLAAVGSDGVPRVRRYWDPRALLETWTQGPEAALERLVELLGKAAGRSVTGNDVVLLSGGVDSPTVAAFAAPAHLAASGRPLQALSAVYPDQPTVDERPYIEIAADRLGLPLRTYVPVAGPLDDAAFWVDLLDGPVDVLAVPQVAEAYRLARDLGAVNVLTGELAEHAFEIRGHLMDHLVSHRRWGAVAHHVRSRRAAGAPMWRIVRSLLNPLVPHRLGAAFVRAVGRDRRQIPAWVDPGPIGGLGARPDLERPMTRRWTEIQLLPFRGSAITFEADEICAAWCGVNVRRPFGDIDLWEFALSLPAEVKFPDPTPKQILRRAARGRVPDEILDRSDKTVFDEFALAKAPYPDLRKWLAAPRTRLEGVDYACLADRVEHEDMTVVELRWAKDLARIHAFLSLWE